MVCGTNGLITCSSIHPATWIRRKQLGTEEEGAGMNQEQQNIIIYNTADGKASVKLLARDGRVWISQGQLAALFDLQAEHRATSR